MIVPSVETANEETAIETPVHTEPSSVEEIVTDTHNPVKLVLLPISAENTKISIF